MLSATEDDFKVGNLVYEGKPFAFVIYHSRSEEFCDFCAQENEAVKKCANCKYVRYCDQNCQKAAWSEHKRECKLLQNLRGQESDLIRLIGKVIIKLKTEEGKNFVDTIGMKTRTFTDLISHKDDMKKSDKGTKMAKYLMDRLHVYMGSLSLPKDAIIEIIGKVYYNRYQMHSEHLSSYGSGLYIGASVFDHACIPNSFRTFKNRNIVIRAIRPFPKGDITKANISYMDLFDSNEVILTEAFSSFYGNCYCADCSLPHGESVLMKIIDKEKGVEVMEFCKRALARAREVKDRRSFSDALAIVDEALKKQENVLGITNIMRLKLLYFKFVKCTDEYFPDGIQWGKELLEDLKETFGPYSNKLLEVYYILFFYCFDTDDYMAALKYKEETLAWLGLFGMQPNRKYAKLMSCVG